MHKEPGNLLSCVSVFHGMQQAASSDPLLNAVE